MLNQTPNSVLLVSSSERLKYLIKTTLMDHHYYYQIKTVSSGSEARRELLNQEYDFIIINSPLQDEFGDKLAIEFKEQTKSETIMLVANENYNLINDSIMPFGVITLPKPLSKNTFFQTLNVCTTSIVMRKSMENDNLKMKQKMEEMRIISKAKCCLIEHEKMTEEEAHKYIEREAMDKRIKKVQIAIEILNKY